MTYVTDLIRRAGGPTAYCQRNFSPIRRFTLEQMAIVDVLGEYIFSKLTVVAPVRFVETSSLLGSFLRLDIPYFMTSHPSWWETPFGEFLFSTILQKEPHSYIFPPRFFDEPKLFRPYGTSLDFRTLRNRLWSGPVHGRVPRSGHSKHWHRQTYRDEESGLLVPLDGPLYQRGNRLVMVCISQRVRRLVKRGSFD